MKGYRPLLIENLGISLPVLDVLRLQLNEHLQGTGRVFTVTGMGSCLFI